jgi:formate dehydrogenase subunit gamma
VQDLICQYQAEKGALLPLLHAIQDQYGFIPAESVAHIAKGLNLSRAEVHGVLTYYHYFKTQAPKCYQVQICQAEACQANGALALMAQARQTIEQQKTSASPLKDLTSVQIEPVYCLGLCACAPAVQINQQLYARVSLPRMQQLLSQLESQK